MLPTAATHLTFDEYLKYNDEKNNRYEVVNGGLVLMNSPSVRHTITINFVEKKFDAEIERLCLPWIALKNTGFITGVKDSRLPDLSVITKGA